MREILKEKRRREEDILNKHFTKRLLYDVSLYDSIKYTNQEEDAKMLNYYQEDMVSNQKDRLWSQLLGELKTRSANCLERRGVKSVSQLVAILEDVQYIDGCGIKTYVDILAVLLGLEDEDREYVESLIKEGLTRTEFPNDTEFGAFQAWILLKE